MKLVNLKTQQFEDVPDDQAQAAFEAGTHGFESPDAKVPIKAPDGSLGTVDAKDAADAFSQGATVASHQEYRTADLEARHGGLGGSLAAAGEGLARGATVGLSDPIAIKIAEMLGQGEAVRTHLAEEKEAHPYISTGAEILGAAAPTLATGGAAAPEEAAALGGRALAEGANLARTGAEVAEAATPAASRMQQLLRVVGAPARGVSAIGEDVGAAAESAMRVVTGSPAADSAIGRIARMAVKSGATGAAEGAAFAVGNEISEDSLGDHELNAEKLAAAIGHGAMWGAMFGAGAGAGLTAAKETLGPILTKVAPHLERQADLQAVRAFNPTTQVMKEAEGRAGGAAELGATARKYGIIPESPLEAAKLGPEELLTRTSAAKEQAGAKVGEIVAGSKATVPVSEILGPLDSRITKLEQTAAGKTAARSLRSFRDDLAESLMPKLAEQPAVAAEAVKPPARVLRTPKEIQEALDAERAAGREVQFSKSGAPPDHILYKTAEAPAENVAAPAVKPTTAPGDVEVPVAKLIEERRALQHRIFEDQKTLQPKWPLAEMREFSGELNAIEQKAIDGAEHDLGKDQGKALREANKDYQRLAILEGAAQTKVAKATALRAVSPTSYGTGMAVGAGLLAHGNPLGAAAGVASAYGHKLVLEHGNAIASAMFGKIAKLDLIARASEAVDGKIDAAVTEFVTKKTPAQAPKIRLRHFGSQPDEDLQDRARTIQQEGAGSRAARVTLEHVERAVPGLAQHAPKTAQALAAIVGKTAQLQAASAPKSMAPVSILSRTPRPSDEEAARYVRESAAREDPVGTIVRGLETGKIHWDEIAAIRESKPKMYRELQMKLLDEVSKHRDDMDYDKVLVLSKIVGVPLDPSLEPANVAAFQQTFQPTQSQPAAPQNVARAPKRKLDGIAKDATLSTGNVDAA